MIINNFEHIKYTSDLFSNLFGSIQQLKMFSLVDLSYKENEVIKEVESESINILNKLKISSISKVRFYNGSNLDFSEPYITLATNKEIISVGFDEVEDKIFKSLENITDKVITIGIRENEKNFTWYSTLDVNIWGKFYKIPIPQPMKIIPMPSPLYPDYKELSKEHIPNHMHRMNINEGLIFTTAWQMYFGKVYYKYIPKPLFDDFKDCEENIILEHGVRRITLYKNPDDFLQSESIQRMWSFRRRLGIDSIAHELTFDKNRIEPENLPVVITKQNCIKGQTKVTRFLDKNYQLVDGDKAVYKEVKEYLDDGVTVVFEEITEIN